MGETQRLGWDKLTGVQQRMLEQVPGIEPATEGDKPKPRRTPPRGERAQQQVVLEDLDAVEARAGGRGQLSVSEPLRQTVAMDLRILVAPDRDPRLPGAATLSEDRRDQLSAIGMRWS